MQIIVHVNGFNEWVPVPADVDPKTAQFKKGIENGIVKESINGGFTMKCPKAIDTHVLVNTTEDDIAQCALQEMTRGDRQYLTRVECVTRLLARHVIPQQCHASHIEEFQIGHDDGPDEVLFTKMLDEHIACGNLQEMDRAPMLEAYMTPTDVDDHHNHLHTHFRVKPAKLAAFRTKRETHETNVRAVQEHFHARRASVLAGVIAPNHESKKEVSQ